MDWAVFSSLNSDVGTEISEGGDGKVRSWPPGRECQFSVCVGELLGKRVGGEIGCSSDSLGGGASGVETARGVVNNGRDSVKQHTLWVTDRLPGGIFEGRDCTRRAVIFLECASKRCE